MTLDPILDSTEGLPADVASHYVQDDDGKFRLDVNGVDVSRVQGLFSAYEKVKAERSDFLGKLKAFDGLDPDDARKAIEERGKASKDKQADSERITAMREEFRQQLADRDKGIKARDDAIVSARRDAVIAAALAKHEGASHALLMPILRDRVRGEMNGDPGNVRTFVVNEDGNEAISRVNSGAPKSVAELLDEMSKMPEYAGAFPRMTKKGSGAHPTDAPTGPSQTNPWDPKHRNVTKQMEIARSDPTLAKRMAAQHGVELDL